MQMHCETLALKVIFSRKTVLILKNIDNEISEHENL